MSKAGLAPKSTITRKSGTLRVAGKRVDVTNVDKPLYPDGFTKGDVIAYYSAVAPTVLPHLRGRAVTLKRYPDGTESQFFFQKNCAAHRPEWVKTVKMVGTTTETHHCLIDAEPQLLWAANLAAIELHVPMAKAAKPNTPTTMVFDLDPGPGLALTDCLTLGLRLRELLGRFDLECFAKTSGKKGLHVYVPLNTPKVTFDRTKSFARAVAMMLEKEDPTLVTATMAKARRSGRIFIDWSQNDEHKTTVAAYSLRAMDAPHVSTPITWTEVTKAARIRETSPLSFIPSAVLARLSRRGDLFAPVLTLRQPLPDLKAR